MKLIVSLSSLLLLISGIARADLLYNVDFDAPLVRQAVDRCPYAKVETDFENNRVLTVTVPPEALEGNPDKMAVRIPIDFNAIGANGNTIEVIGDMGFRNVSKPKFYYNGAKFMLSFQQGDRMQYPAFLPSSPSTQNTWGSRNWFHTSGTAAISSDTRDGTLTLGLQDAHGEVSFKNIRFYTVGKAPVSTLSLTEIPQAVYTREIPMRRGVMSPSTSRGPREEDFAELARWNANLIRWQLTQPKIDSLDQYRKDIYEALDDVGIALDLSWKYGLQLVIDLHPTVNLPLVMGTAEGREFLEEFWLAAVKKYKDHPALWGYNFLNEPHSRVLQAGDPSYVEIAEKLIRVIRKADPLTPIIVEPDHLGGPQYLEFLPIFDSPNIYYSVHMYIPGELTHQLNREQESFHEYPTETWNKEYLRSWLERVRLFQKNTGARIFVGEFSCIRWAPGADRYIADLIELFEEYQWDWCYHAFREWDGWSVEHSDDPTISEPVASTSRKEILLEAFKKNLKSLKCKESGR